MTYRYLVGTRDTAGRYRACRVDARDSLEARAVAVRRCEDLGIYARAVSARRLTR